MRRLSLLQRVMLSVVLCVGTGVWAQTANPNGYGGAPAMMASPQVVAPDFHGMTLQEAQAANVMVSSGQDGTKRPIFSALSTTGPEDGVVDTQTPTAGTRVYPGRQKAMLYLKAVQETVPVLKGMSVAEARARLAQSSLGLGKVAGDATDGASLRIATQSPLAGTSVAAQSVVDVVLQAAPGGTASGATGVQDGSYQLPVVVTVPNVLKMRADAAAAKLESAGLGRAIVLGPAAGLVVLQTPAAGEQMATGGRVRLTMGTQVHEIVVPQQQGTGVVWWWVAGGVVLLGSVAAILYGVRRAGRPATGKAAAGTMRATMVGRANPASAKVTVAVEAAVRWSVQLRDKPAAGVTTVQGEIEGKRRGEGGGEG